MIDSKMEKWIKDSKNWLIGTDFETSTYHEKEQEGFYFRYDDFYIGIIYLLNKLLRRAEKDIDYSESDEFKKNIFSIAKGLEIFSLYKAKEHFYGVNINKNFLVIASLFYLSDYPTNAKIILEKYKILEENKDFKANSIFLYLFHFITQTEESNSNLYSLYSEIDKKIGKIRLDLEGCHLYNPNEIIYYRLAFLLTRKYQNNNVVQDLLKIENDKNFWKKYLENNKEIKSFFPSQRKALSARILDSSETFTLKMPTSAGKTKLIELLIFYEVSKKNKSVLFLVPFRSLASELKLGMSKRLIKMGIKTHVIYASIKPTQEEIKDLEETDCLITTPEKYYSFYKLNPETALKFNTIILDEGHIIDDPSRGILYETIISLLKKSEMSKRFIFISAIIPNIEKIHSWLKGHNDNIIKSDYKPTEIKYSYLEEKKENYDLIFVKADPEKPFVITNILSKDLIELRIPKSGESVPLLELKEIKTNDLTLHLALKLLSLNYGSILLFLVKKDSIERLADHLCELCESNNLIFNKPISYCKEEKVKELCNYLRLKIGESDLLYRSVKNGFIFHHGGISQEIREVLEFYIREKYIRLIISNKTLSEGVNLPIKTILIVDIKATSEDMLKRDLVNLFGRAGRSGKESLGLIVSLPVVNGKLKEIFEDQVNNKPINEPINGQLNSLLEEIKNQIINENLQIETETTDSLFNNDEKYRKSTKQNSNFYQQIDNLIFSSLIEEYQENDFENQYKRICEESFSLFEATQEIKDIFKKLMQKRWNLVFKSLNSEQFRVFKKSGLNLDDFLKIEKEIENIDLSINEMINKKWINENKEWINEITKMFLSLEKNKKEVQRKIESNTLVNIYEITTEIMIEWLSGKSYYEISKQITANHKIENFKPQDFISSILLSHFDMFFSSVLAIANAKSIKVSYYCNIFSKSINIGIETLLGHAIYDLGFKDRDLNQAISKVLEHKYDPFIISWYDPSYIKEQIQFYEGQIEANLNYSYPKIILEKFKETIKQLK